MNLDELAKQYGGTAVSSTNLDELAKRYGGVSNTPVIDENAKSAPFSLKNLAIGAGSGGLGGIKALTDLFGATNVASEKLGEAQQAAQAMKTPERQAEIARREAIKERAKGNTWEEIKALAGGFAEAPLEETVEALASGIPIIAGTMLAPAAAVPAGLARLGMAGRAINAARSPAAVIGAGMGLGGQKGQDYQTVKQEALKQGKSPEEAESLAQAASEYSLQNAPRQLASTATGALEGVLGVESLLGKMGKASPKVDVSKGVKAPTYSEAILKNIAGEAAPEFVQGATGQLGSNQALNQAGMPTDMMSGVLASAIHDMLVGGTLGAATSPIKMSELRKNYAEDQLAKERAVEAKFEAGIKAEEEKLAQTKETFKQPDLLGLPAPAKEIAPSIDEPVLVNPLGNITPDELGPEVTKYVNKYRKDNGMPNLQSYSIEDIKDAMTAVNPEGEQGALDAILTAKTGYSGTEKYTPEDVTNAALEKNIASDTKGFNDFLSRTTGNPDLTTMSPPQLFSAFKALKDMPANETGAQIVFPEGTNASRFKPAQYKKAIDYVGLTFDEMGGTPLSIDTIVKDIQESTGLETERDARALLDTAIKNNDLAENREVVFRTIKPDTGELVSTFRDKGRAEAAAKKQGLNIQETTLVTVKPAVKEETTKPRAALPEGYDIAETAFVEGEKPTGYNIAPEGRVKPLATVMEENEIPAKIERLQGLRRTEAAKFLQDVTKHEGTVKRGRVQLEAMEARGELDTEGYKKAQSRQFEAEDVLGRRIASLLDRIEQYSAPLQAKPVGKKTITRKGFTVSKQGQKSGTFPTREAAEESILADLPDEALDALVSDKKFGGLQNRAVAEQNRRRSPQTEGKKVSEVLKAMEPKKQSPEAIEKTKELRAKLDKMGLQDVALKIVEAIEAKADGSYGAKLIQIALDSKNPIRTMRHEAMHALKELGFFTDAQWASLEKMARSKWKGQYLDSKNAYLPSGKPVTRYEAYTLPKEEGGQGLTESEALEEAIADAFGDFDVNKAPPGMLTALLNKMRNFFEALNNYLAGRGFESYQDVFGKIEKGELKATEAKGAGTKLSLAGEGVPMSTRNLMEVQTPIAQQQLGLSTEIKRGRFNNVRSIAIALNQFTLDNIGPMDRNDLSTQESTQIARAIADEVAYQLGTQAKTGTGLGWYSNNYPKAVRRLARRFPELGTSKYARSVFSALVAVTSNGERVTKNIDNAIKLYAKLRQGKPLVAMSNRRATALENNLTQIQRLMDTCGEDFESVLLKEITVKEMNARLREMGEESDGSYLANTVVPAAAVYFGPKLGAFYANLSGSEGYLTMDLWWTRSINRMRGLLIPKATEASIDKFRDMMDIPDATRDEVIAASVPLRNKYKEYKFNTELEHIVGTKEPAKKEKKLAWFKKAEEAAGDAYDQMLYEHNLEKMANTIYKNEFEMLAEAPFTATDRKFMYDAARKAQTMLRKEDIDLTLADIQAGLWYYEKRLYAKLSGKKADDIGYEEAIIAQSNQGNGRARPSVVFDRQPNGGTQPGGEGGQINPIRGKSYTAQQGLRDENIQSGEPAVRSSTGSGKKFSLRGERGGQREDSRFTPLALSPSVKGFHGPDPRIVEVAERYAEKNGINLKRQAEYVQVEGNKDAEDRATRIAKAYEDMRHDPQNPEVKEAYQNLIDQTISQYEALVDAGYKFWFIDLNNSDNLDYLSSPWNALRDMRSNKQMGIFPTNVGFGSNEDFDPSNNPLLQETEFEWPIGSLNGPKQKVLANDVFRAVHDVFGHGLEGAGFRATGEENAWQAHSRLFTGSALKAITSETRGQNSAVNYGLNGEFNRKANPADTIYADQKVGLMPAWTWKEGLSADEPIFQELDSKKDATRFLNAVERVKLGRPYAFPLHVHDLDTYKNAKLFLSEDEESGFALIGDEIGSFFSGGRGQAYPTLRLAVDEGGRRIDTYRTKLPSVMGKANFQPVARVEFNAELATPLWDKNKFKQFQGGKPDLVFYSYDPSFNARGDKDAGDLAVSKTPLVEYDEAVRLQKEAVKNTKYSLRGITLGEQQPQAQSFNGVHYGKTKVDTLSGSKYGTGIRGAERRRLDDAFDDRIKRRAYFYIPKEDGSMPLPESGLGGYVYTQKFNNILGPGQEMSRLFSQAKGDSNDFESNVVDAGYDGYAIPKMGMMVVLNHDVPVSYEGTKFEYDAKKKLSLRAAPDTPAFKRWFGDSKVVDANGEPKVMYHGTGQDILAFRGKQADAIFLTDDPSFAEKFSKDSAAWMSAHPEETLSKAELAQGVKDAIAAIHKDYKSRPEGKVMIDSLKAGTYKDATAEAQEYLRNAYKEMMPSGPNILPVYVSAQNPFDYQNPSHVRRVMSELTEGAYDANDIRRGDWQTIENEDFQEAIQMAGFDGFYVQENGRKNLAVYNPTQIKSATGNIGTYDVNNPDIRYSLREFNSDELPRKSKSYTLPANTLLFHGAHEARAKEIEGAGKVLIPRSPIKTSGGTLDEGGLIFFGDKETATGYANSERDPISVQAARDRGESRNPGVVFETATDRPYKLMNKNYKLTKKEANDLNKVLGIPDYKYLTEGDTAKTAAYRAVTNSSTVDRYKTNKGEMLVIWPKIFNTLGYDGFFDDFAVALTADNGIRLVGESGKMQKFSLRNIGDEIRSMPNGKDIYGSMKGTTTTRDEKGFIERMMDAISPESRSSIRQKALNRYNQLSVYDRELVKKMGGAPLLADASAEAGALQSDLAAGVAAAALGVRNRKGGIPVFKNGMTTVDTSVKGPIEIFYPLAAMGDPEAYQAYQFWAGAKRGSRFLADGKEKVFTPAMVNYAKQLCDVDAKGNVTGKYPEFAKIQKEWTEYNNGLVDYMVDTGVLSKEKANEFKRHGDYIPFYRQLDGEKTVGPNIFQSISGVKPPKAIKHGEAPLADFLETVVRNTQAAIQSGMKNTAAQRAVDVAVQIQQAKQLPEQSSAPDTVTVLRGGKPVSYQTADPLFIEAVKSLNLPELPFLSILSGPANLLRNLVTKDPGFMLVNLMRDSMSAYVTSGANMLPVVDTVKNFGRAIKGDDPVYQALINAGIGGGYEFSKNIEASGEALAKDLRKKTGTQTGFEKTVKPFTSLWDTLEKGSEASDFATRMAVYKDTLARTNNEAEALFRALEVMNFNRKGSSAVVRIITAAIPFLNARMQGLDVFYRAAFGRMGNVDAKAIQRSFLIRGATMASLSVMYWALTHDDDDYKKQEQETKDNNWLIPSLGLKIAIPFEVGVLFKVIPERIAAYMFGNDTGKDFAKSMGRQIESTFAVSYLPQVIQPLDEARTNYSRYTGRPIVGQNLESLAPQYQIGPNTTNVAQWLGKELKVSPLKIDHVIQGYTGTMGMYIVNLMDAIGDVNSNSPKAAKRFEQLPFFRRIMIDKEARGTITSYFELKHAVDETVRTFNSLERAGKGEDLAEYTRENAKMLMTRDFISSMDKDIKEINEMAMAVRNSPMSPEAKRDALTALNRASNAMTAKIQNVRKAVE